MAVPAPLWLSVEGSDADVVVSTRCRLARNLAGFPFPWRAGELERKQAAEAILHAAQRGGGPLGEAEALPGGRIDTDTADHLRDWRYASRDWLEGGSHRWLMVAPDGLTSLQVHEEDHIRLQVIAPGLQVEYVHRVAEEAARRLEDSVAFARSVEVGYLTASLTNAGTGMRLSVLLHLPGLAVSAERDAILEAAAVVGCAVRGLHGEGTRGTGELFQVSNTYTFGVDAATTAARVHASAAHLVEAERRARRMRFGSEEGRQDLAEGTWRALEAIFSPDPHPGTLLPAVSVLRLAVSEGLLAGSMVETAEWLAVAGVEAALAGKVDRTKERYELVRRSAALRQRLRRFVE
jgi:protein arginine kinase